MLLYKTIFIISIFFVAKIKGACDKSVLTHKNYRLLNTRPNCGKRQHEPTSSVSSRIMNGTDGSKGEFPWLVYLEFHVTKPREIVRTWCGGSLINNLYVVTAAHCITRFKNSSILEYKMFAKMGRWKISESSDVTEIPIKSSTCYEPNYFEHNDICLLRLERAVTFNEYISPICLPLSCYLQNKDLECYDLLVAGWGYSQYYPTPLSPDVVQKLRMEVKDQRYCQDQWRGEGTIEEYHLCAEADSKYKTPCPGDSGGPLMLETALRGKSVYYLIGILSKGWPCDRRDEALVPPLIYTRVNFFLKWMLDNITD